MVNEAEYGETRYTTWLEQLGFGKGVQKLQNAEWCPQAIRSGLKRVDDLDQNLARATQSEEERKRLIASMVVGGAATGIVGAAALNGMAPELNGMAPEMAQGIRDLLSFSSVSGLTVMDKVYDVLDVPSEILIKATVNVVQELRRMIIDTGGALGPEDFDRLSELYGIAKEDIIRTVEYFRSTDSGKMLADGWQKVLTETSGGQRLVEMFDEIKPFLSRPTTIVLGAATALEVASDIVTMPARRIRSGIRGMKRGAEELGRVIQEAKSTNNPKIW